MNLEGAINMYFNEEVSNPGEKYKTSLYLEMSSIIEKLQIEGI